jgi:hypothetical protein
VDTVISALVMTPAVSGDSLRPVSGHDRPMPGIVDTPSTLSQVVGGEPSTNMAG